MDDDRDQEHCMQLAAILWRVILEAKELDPPAQPSMNLLRILP